MHLCVNGADARFCLHKLHNEYDAHGDFRVCRLNEDINTGASQ